MISLIDLLAFHSIPGVGDQTIRKIIRLNLTTKDITKLNDSSLSKIFTSQKSLQIFKENFQGAQENAEYEVEKYASQGIEVIHYFHDSYSPTLALLEDFPLFLFCRGNVQLLKHIKNIAVIGTRECSEVGAKIAWSTAKYFAEKNYTIVSGLAKGIDAVRHKAALEAKGHTIAVLIDVSKIYPKENTALANAILDNNGLLISENKPGSFQGKNSFVLRDRLQSGLSLGVFPIETDIKGGTMHTVKYASKQHRLLFVPDMFNSSIRSQYFHSVGPEFDKARGIIELINTKQAFPYTKEDYGLIENKLHELIFELEKSFHFLNPEDPRFYAAVKQIEISNFKDIKNIPIKDSEVDLKFTENIVDSNVAQLDNNPMPLKNVVQDSEIDKQKIKADILETKFEELKAIILNFNQKENDYVTQMKAITIQMTTLKKDYKIMIEEGQRIQNLLSNFEGNFKNEKTKAKEGSKLSLFDSNL